MKKADPNPKANRNILKLVYVIVALFLGLIAYMAYFLQARGEDVINNSYNARLDSFADRIIRGKILALLPARRTCADSRIYDSRKSPSCIRSEADRRGNRACSKTYVYYDRHSGGQLSAERI